MTEPFDPRNPVGPARLPDDPIEILNDVYKFKLHEAVSAIRANTITTIRNAFDWKLHDDMVRIDELGEVEAKRLGLYIVPVKITPPFENEASIDVLAGRMENEMQTTGDILFAYLPLQPEDVNPYQVFRHRHLPRPEVVYFARAKRTDQGEEITTWYVVGEQKLYKAVIDGESVNKHVFTYIEDTQPGLPLELDSGEFSVEALRYRIDPVHGEVLQLSIDCVNMNMVRQPTT